MKKSQIKRFPIQKLSQNSSSQSTPQLLITYRQVIEQKRKKLQIRRDDLLHQLQKIRSSSQKTVYLMVDGVKDRLDKNQKIIMNAASRPSKQDVKSLTQLFTYMENQTNLINNNSKQTHNLHHIISQFLKHSQFQYTDFTALDQQFTKLQNQCQYQQNQLKKLQQQKQQNILYYKTIQQQIEQVRIKYQSTQSQIQQKQRQLDRLTSYYNLRQYQDNQKIQYQNNTAIQLQLQTLKTQSIFNINTAKTRDLQITELQYQGKKLQGV